MKKQSRWMAFARRFVLLLTLLGVTGGGFIPREAAAMIVYDPICDAEETGSAAYDAILWKSFLAILAAIEAVLLLYYEALREGFDNILKTYQDCTDLELEVLMALIDLRIELTQAIVDSKLEDVYLRKALDLSMKNIQADDCAEEKSVMMSQLPILTKDFEQSIVNIALSAIELAYRGEGEDGAGPQYSRTNFEMRCEKKFGNPVNFPSECVDSSTTSIDGRKLYDADLSMATITGGMPLELPQMSTVTKDGVNYQIPNPQTTAQKFWTAGLYYCLNLSGPRPSPPYGDEMKVPQLKAARAKWNQTAAKQSQLIRPCVELLAYHTRPNSTLTTLVEKQKDFCTVAAEKFGIEIPETFENCTNGLSSYQAAFLSNMVCKSPQFYVIQKGLGATDQELVDMTIGCSETWSLFREKHLAKQNAVMEGAIGLLDLSGDWDDVKRLMQTKDAR